MAKSQAVATKQDQLPATMLSDYAIMNVDAQVASEIVRDTLGGGISSHLQLQRLTVPSGTSAPVWQIPSLDGEAELLPVLQGVILRIARVRVYYAKPFAETGGGAPPDCVSVNCVTGHGDPGGDCNQCPLAKFGSADQGSGQACSERRLIFLMPQSGIIPVVVDAPPTSLKAISQYQLLVANQMMRTYEMVTALTLEKDKSGDGFDYWRIVPKRVGGKEGRITGEELARVQALAEMVAPLVDSAEAVASFAKQDEPPF